MNQEPTPLAAGRKKNRFEEDRLSPAVRDYFIKEGYQAECEIRIPIRGWRAGRKRGRFIRLDVVAWREGGAGLVIVETKAACYPQIIGTAVGELLLYEHVLTENNDAFAAALAQRGIQPRNFDNHKLYCAFPDLDIKNEPPRWNATEATAAFQAIAKGRIGLLLVRLGQGVPQQEWWADVQKEHLNVVEVL